MSNYTVETHYLDVGQGDCSIILVKDVTNPNTPEIVRTVVIDCGSDRTPEGTQPGVKLPENSPGNILYRELRKMGIRRINVLIISHYDRDHFNGIVELLTSNSSKRRNLFKEVNIYDMGSILTQSTRKISGIKSKIDFLELNQVSWKALYKQYTEALYDLNENYGFNIQRHTERVYCGWPEHFNYIGKVLSSKTDQQPQNRNDQTLLVHTNDWAPLVDSDDKNHPKTSKIVSVNFKSCRYLLGKDLLNFHVKNNSDKIPNIHLYCVGANGWFIKNGSSTYYRPRISSDKKNNFSLGVLLQFDEYSALFAGDLSSKVEDQLSESVLSYSDHGLAVLKAAHHGSKNSTSKNLLKNLSPNTVVITCGETGTHDHPNIETIERLAESDDVKKVVVSSFGVHEYDKVSYNKLIKRYRKVHFPTEFSDPYNPDGKFSVAGASWEMQAGHFTIFDIEQTTNVVDFKGKFYAGFEMAVLEDVMDDFEDGLFISSKELLTVGMDLTTNENLLELDPNGELTIGFSVKRKANGQLARKILKKRRVIDTQGNNVVVISQKTI